MAEMVVSVSEENVLFPKEVPTAVMEEKVGM
jgi:hypothetical protein